MFIMYDFDGTLIDSTEAIYESFCVATKKELDIEFCKTQIGLPIDIILSNLNIKKEDMKSVIEKYKTHYQKIYLNKTYMLDGAKESIDLATNHGKIALVTTKSTSSSINLLKHFGVFDKFSTVVGRDDVVNPKPDKEPLLLAMSRANEKENCFMIGDTIYDLMAAKNAGITGIASVYKYQSKDALKEYGKYVCDSILEATKLAISLAKL